MLPTVALFTRAWIEMLTSAGISPAVKVALFTRAWIEIRLAEASAVPVEGRPLYEGVD